MRVAFISDLHAFLSALDAVLADAYARGADQVICLGDVVDLGPQPSETLERLREAGIPVVRGNHDTLDENPQLSSLRSVEDWTRERLSVAQREWLDTRPFELRLDLEGVRVWCVHASPSSIIHGVHAESVHEDVGSAMDGPWDVLVAGHTHVPFVRRIGQRLVINVGSVGQPFAEPVENMAPRVHPWAEYAMVEVCGGLAQASLHRVPIDVAALGRTLHRVDFPDAGDWLDHWDRA